MELDSLYDLNQQIDEVMVDLEAREEVDLSDIERAEERGEEKLDEWIDDHTSRSDDGESRFFNMEIGSFSQASVFFESAEFVIFPKRENENFYFWYVRFGTGNECFTYAPFK